MHYRIIMIPSAVEFLVHMALGAAVASVNSLAEDTAAEREATRPAIPSSVAPNLSQSEHIPQSESMVRPQQLNQLQSVTGERLDLQWRQLRHVEYLTDGGNSWIHTAILDGRPVVVKTLKPECQDVALAINEIESELGT
jgi:SH3-like domain-containing protein